MRDVMVLDKQSRTALESVFEIQQVLPEKQKFLVIYALHGEPHVLAKPSMDAALAAAKELSGKHHCHVITAQAVHSCWPNGETEAFC